MKVERNVTFKAAVFSAVAAVSAVVFGYEEPVYTVTVADDATVSLDSATVEVTQGGTTESKLFSELTLAGGTFVKKGAGWLESSKGMATFTGELVIEDGVFKVAATGHAGKTATANNSYKTNWTDVASVVVSNGATLALSGSPLLKQPISVSGRGFDNLGAIYSIDSKSSQFYYSQMTLLGDTMFRIKTKGVKIELGNLVLDMNGHDLEFLSENERGQQTLSNIKVVNPGNMVLNGTEGYFSGAHMDWEGDADNTVTLTNNAFFRTYALSGEKIKWTLVNTEENQGMYAYEAGSRPSWNSTSVGLWGGPLRIEKDILIGNTAGTSGDDAFSVHGPVTGPGGITLKYQWLRLLSGENTFEGGVTVKDGGNLVLYKDGSVPANGGAIDIEPGGALLFDDVGKAYNLPSVSWEVDSGETVTFEGGAGGTIASLKKTGDGTLTLDGYMAVTGKTELAAGTFKFEAGDLFSAPVYSSSPGLNERITRYDYDPLVKHYGKVSVLDEAYKKFISDNELFGIDPTNDFQKVTEGSELFNVFKTGWPMYQFVSYDGYIWNRSPTNEFWSLALSVTHRGIIKIDGENVCESCTIPDKSYRETVWPYLRTNTVEVTPGHHKFEARVFNFRFANAGASAATKLWDDENGCVMSNDNKEVEVQWETGKGFVFNRTGNMTIDVNDYETPMNGAVSVCGGGSLAGGDGFLFTRTAEDTDECDFSAMDITWCPFSNLVAAAGTVIDAGGSVLPLTVPELEGFVRITDGNLRVSSGWTVDANAAEAGACLEVDGELEFTEGAAISVELTGGRVSASPDEGWTIAEAAGGITLPEGWLSDVTFPDNGYKLSLSADGKKLQLRHYNGTVFIVR